MKFSVLGSGSKGNCTLVEAGETRLLIDNGFSCRESIARLASLGVPPESLHAILLTHEHQDHIRGVGVLSRRLGIPVYANTATHGAAAGSLGRLSERREFTDGESFRIGGLDIRPFSVCHDTADPVGFVFSDGTSSLGYCTDTGRVTGLIRHHLRQCGALILEANHDVALLKKGPYPPHLKQRVLSSQGHLSNRESLRLAAELAADRLRILVLSHLSEINNHPDLVLREAEELAASYPDLRILVAGQHRPGPSLSC